MTLRANSVRSLSRALTCTIAVVLSTLLGLAAAQATPAPRVGVAPLTSTVGSAVTLEADRLEPGAQYRIERVAPSGERQVLERRADRDGRLVLSLRLEEPGTSEIRLLGPGVDAVLRARAEPLAPDAPAADALPTDDGTATEEPAPTAPDAARDATPETPTAPPAVALPPAPAAEQPLTLVIEDGDVIALDADGSTRWRFSRPTDSGGTRAALLHLGRAWIAHGHTVLELDTDDGQVLSRAAVSGPIVTLEPSAGGVRAVAEFSVAGERLTSEHRVDHGYASPPGTFAPDSPVLGWWRAEADVADPSAALRRDPTNPHLYLRVAALSDDDADRERAARGAVMAGGPFFERAHVARALYALGFPELAAEAMEVALADFAARGYDAALLTDTDAHERFGFALRPLQRALLDGNIEAARFWATWLPRSAGVGMPGAATTLRAVAEELRLAGDADGAAAMREQATALAATNAYAIVSRAAVDLGRGGWYAAAALVAAALILHLTLVAKYWRVQELLIRRARESGRRASASWHWRALRHYGTTEKLALVLLLAAAHAVAALAVWSERGDAAVTAVASGHLEAPFVTPYLQPLLTGNSGRGLLVSAYRAERAGDGAEAAALLERAVATGVRDADEALAALTSGVGIAPSPTVLRESLTGSWARAIADAYLDPFGYLGAVADERLPAWVSPLALGVFLLVLALHLLALLIPRPRLSRNAPRTPLYHLLALLVPGSGATDELWGVLLLVPWAVFSIDALMQLLASGSPLGIPLFTGTSILAALYIVNAVAWAIEFASYRRRMRSLRRDQPDLAIEYGMQPLPAGR